MAALREILAVFDIIVNDSKLDAADKKLDSFVDKLKGVATAFAAFGIIKTIASFGEHVASAAREVEFHAQRMEMDTDEYQKLAQVAKDYGITTEQLQIANTIFTRGLSSMGGTMGEFTSQTNQAKEGMRNLHLNVRQFRGQKLEQILPVIADAMQKVDDPMERVAIGIRLFGHRGRAMMQLMAVGGDEMRRAFAAAVPVFEKATIESANKATVAGNQLSRTWDNLVNNSFGKALLDAFTWTARKLTDIVLVMKELTKHSEIGKGILIALAIASTVAAGMVIAAWWPVLLPIAAIVAAFAALALIIHDLIVFMEGGDSVPGDLLDHFFGPGGADKMRETVKGMWEDIKKFFADVNGENGSNFFTTIRDITTNIRNLWREIRADIEWVTGAAQRVANGIANTLGVKAPNVKADANRDPMDAVFDKIVGFSGTVGDLVGLPRDIPLPSAMRPTVPATSAAGLNYTPAGANMSINIDARGANPGEVHQAVSQALDEHVSRQNRDAMSSVGGSQ